MVWRAKVLEPGEKEPRVICCDTEWDLPARSLVVVVTENGRIVFRQHYRSEADALREATALRERLLPQTAVLEFDSRPAQSTDEQRRAWWESLSDEERERRTRETEESRGAQVGSYYKWADMPFRHGKFKRG